jgi:TonB family protein
MATPPRALSTHDARRPPYFLASPLAAGQDPQKSTVRFFAGRLKWTPLVLSFLAGLPGAQPSRLAPGEVPSQVAQTPASSGGATSTARASAPLEGSSSVSAATPPYRFDIPAQPLANALEQYGTVSGRPVFFDSSVVAGRTSTRVQGIYTPEVALRMLLDGTGLTLDYAEPGRADAFVLKADESLRATSPYRLSDDAPHDAYDGLVQARIWDAFCSIPTIEPGDYRTAIQFGIDPAGRLTNVRLLHSTGDRERDFALLVTLQHIQLDAPPPPAMAQPLYMVILPREATPGMDCRSRH